jgi:hypothetical protein
VLALTATPGADVPRVQGVVDALHISRIEIREAEDPGIRRYMNEKTTERHVVRMGEGVEGFRDRWAGLMRVSCWVERSEPGAGGARSEESGAGVGRYGGCGGGKRHVARGLGGLRSRRAREAQERGEGRKDLIDVTE